MARHRRRAVSKGSACRSRTAPFHSPSAGALAMLPSSPPSDVTLRSLSDSFAVKLQGCHCAMASHIGNVKADSNVPAEISQATILPSPPIRIAST